MKKIQQSNGRVGIEKRYLRQEAQGRPEEVVFMCNDIKEQTSGRTRKSTFLGKENSKCKGRENRASSRADGRPLSQECSERGGEG